MTIERTLRSTAVVIAILAFADPAVTLDGRVRPRIGLVVQDGPSMALPAVDGVTTRRAAAAHVAADLQRDLGEEFEIVSGRGDDLYATVVVGDRYPADTFPDAARVFTVTVSDRLSPNVRIAEVNAPARVPNDTAVRLAVRVESSGMTGSRSDLVVRARGAEVGRASHTWTQDRDSWAAEVVAVPLGEPPFRFAVHVESGSIERTDLDNAAEIAIDVAARFRVFVLEARPSWASAFVRRALEGDSRFEVVGLSQVSPKVSVISGTPSSSTAGVAGDINRFDRFDVLIVGGLDRLSENEQRALEHFAVERGGAVALVPDSRAATTAAGRLLPTAGIVERLLDRPARLTSASATPQLDASELLEGATVPRDARVLARNPGSDRPIVWASGLGDGRVLFAGAMDAWRFRGAPGGAFDRFWRSTIAGLAMEARPPVEVRLTPNRAAPGERVRVTALVRTLERDRLNDRLAIAAQVGEDPIRLWPDARRGSFSGSFVVDPKFTESSTLVTVSGGEAINGHARLTLDANVREPVGPPLALLARAHDGVDVDPGQIGELERHLRNGVTAPAERRARHPMRSVWWIGPFVVCLSSEWWLRRRRGRR
jgi:hypothetical protein